MAYCATNWRDKPRVCPGWPLGVVAQEARPLHAERWQVGYRSKSHASRGRTVPGKIWSRRRWRRSGKLVGDGDQS